MVDREGQLTATDIPPVVYPDTVHRVLLDAVASGATVEYTIDRASGVPTEWTVDGVGLRYLCLNFTTSPLDVVPDGQCQDEFNLIGS